MFKNILTQFIQLKNPSFKLDDAITLRVLIALVIQKGRCWARSLKFIFRGRFFKTLFLGRGVRFQYQHNIRFGKWNQFEDQVYVSALGRKPIHFGNNVKIGAFSRIITSTSFNNIGSSIKIGDSVGIGEFAYLGGGGGLTIGNDCIIGQYFSCHPENHNYHNTNELIRFQGVTRKGIIIGNNCWIGAKVTILDGVTIGDNCVIAAGAVVTKSMPSNTVIGGLPAKVLKTIKEPTLIKVNIGQYLLN